MAFPLLLVAVAGLMVSRRRETMGRHRIRAAHARAAASAADSAAPYRSWKASSLCDTLRLKLSSDEVPVGSLYVDVAVCTAMPKLQRTARRTLEGSWQIVSAVPDLALLTEGSTRVRSQFPVPAHALPQVCKLVLTGKSRFSPGLQHWL